MRVEAFIDQYELAAALYGRSADELRARDARQSQPVRRWLATAGGEVAGAVTARMRPDRRMWLSFACPEVAAYGSLTAAAAQGLGTRLYTYVPEGEASTRAALEAAGFATEVVTEAFRVPFDAALGALGRVRPPRFVSICAAADVDEDRLFTLDNAVRQDVPGTDGWRGDREAFRAELADPAAYAVAVDDGNGEYAGLARMWRNPGGPRFGLVGVLRQYRCTPIGPALIKAVLAEAADWGHSSFTTETSPGNRAIHPRLLRLGAESTGRFLQLVRV